MAKYKLKEGLILRPYGVNSALTNDNLTDEIAEFLIETKKANKEDFIINEPIKKINKNGNNK